MASRRVVVDGSNIATEGRTLPSLKQLNEAVLAFLNEYPDTEVTVVVDATFGHRIDASELADFEEAEENNELVSPPAGAIGRGDAFLLRIAGKIGATVLSNDSFQEFHGEHVWLFEEDRLIGGKPVTGIGWIFTPRSPVRGIKSRKAVKDAKKVTGPVLSPSATVSGEVLGPPPVPRRPPPRRKGRAEVADAEAAPDGVLPAGADAQVADAIATATEESVSGGEGGGRRRRRKKRGGRPAEPVNEALPFINFIAEHPLGTVLEGEVETFTSHGAFVLAGGARCYVPISALGDPAPRAARDVLNRGERRPFTVQALDPQRRGIELALPEFAHVAGAPLPETIEAEILEAPVEPLPSPPQPLPSPPSPAGAPVTSRARPRKAVAAARRAAAGTHPEGIVEAEPTEPEPRPAADVTDAVTEASDAPGRPRRARSKKAAAARIPLPDDGVGGGADEAAGLPVSGARPEAAGPVPASAVAKRTRKRAVATATPGTRAARASDAEAPSRPVETPPPAVSETPAAGTSGASRIAAAGFPTAFAGLDVAGEEPGGPRRAARRNPAKSPTRPAAPSARTPGSPSKRRGRSASPQISSLPADGTGTDAGVARPAIDAAGVGVEIRAADSGKAGAGVGVEIGADSEKPAAGVGVEIGAADSGKAGAGVGVEIGADSEKPAAKPRSRARRAVPAIASPAPAVAEAPTDPGPADTDVATAAGSRAMVPGVSGTTARRKAAKAGRTTGAASPDASPPADVPIAAPPPEPAPPPATSTARGRAMRRVTSAPESSASAPEPVGGPGAKRTERRAKKVAAGLPSVAPTGVDSPAAPAPPIVVAPPEAPAPPEPASSAAKRTRRAPTRRAATPAAVPPPGPSSVPPPGAPLPAVSPSPTKAASRRVGRSAAPPAVTPPDAVLADPPPKPPVRKRRRVGDAPPSS